MVIRLDCEEGWEVRQEQMAGQGFGSLEVSLRLKNDASGDS